MKKHILALVLTMVCISLYAVNPIKEGNMISGHVIVKGTEENIPYATILIKESGQGTVSNEELIINTGCSPVTAKADESPMWDISKKSRKLYIIFLNKPIQ